MREKVMLLFLVLTLLCYEVQAVVNSSDTLVVNNPNRVTIISADTLVEVSVEGSADNDDYRYSLRITPQCGTPTVINEFSQDINFSFPFSKKKKYSTNEFFVSGFGVGFVNALNAPADMNVKMGASFEIMLTHALGYLWRPSRYSSAAFSIGIGIDWKNYRMTGRNYFNYENGYTTVAPYPENADIDYSRIKIFSWTVPFMYQQNITDNFAITLGPVLNFNTYGSVYTRYYLDGKKQTYFNKRIHQNPVTVDLMASVALKGVGVYFKYSPTHVIDKEFGPAFNSISTGFILMF